ncbi:MAG TPA: SprT family zinc-dependent metalloprotease [Tissierellaceae bacterium]|nr:SprT family zinc-dependent metalloprotease [Tissierellaceae bacterium]
MKYISKIRQVECDKGVVEYIFTRKPVKNINLRIKPNGKIYVSANKQVPIYYIDNFIREKQNYIIATLEKFKENQSHVSTYSKNYRCGDEFDVLGKTLQLKVIEGIEESVRSDKKVIFLTVKNKDDVNRKEKIMNMWLKEMQENIFRDICRETYKVFRKYGIKYPNIKIRNMTSRWGSCRPQKGNITLNSRLIEVPRSCIEYVVFHEFAHLIHPNHSKEFYDFLTSLMPDWKDRKKELNKVL